VTVFPFVEYWHFYLIFSIFIMGILALDLGVFHKNAHAVSAKEAGIWSVVWISLALFFNLFFYYFTLYEVQNKTELLSFYNLTAEQLAKNLSLEFLTGFIVEKTLAIDNIFIFALVFSYFAIPKVYHHRILFWGIIGALFFRAFFISIGSILMQYKFVVIFFGALLILTGLKMFWAGSKEQTLENNFVVKILKKIFPVHPELNGQKFFIKINGKRFVTPLFLTLIFIEISDIIFAIDSVPAIFSITKEPLIVFTSNIFAILGLRSLYFLLSGVLDRFYYIKYGLALILIFVGGKMVYLNELFNGKFPISWSLSIIAVIMAGTITLSLLKDRKSNWIKIKTQA